MPWTFAHPAAVLPLKWLWRPLPLAGLVTGSLMPDAGYTLGLFALSKFAHSPLGALLVCLPLGAQLLMLFQYLRSPIVSLLPQPHRAALASLPQTAYFDSLASTGWTVLALLLGAGTHIAWDACTHVDGAVVVHLALLQQRVALGPLGAPPAYKLAQHGSTVLGIAVLAFAYRHWLRQRPAATREPGAPQDERGRWQRLLVLAAASLTLAMLLAFVVVNSLGSGVASPLGAFAFRVIVIVPAVFALLLAVCGWWLGQRR